MKKTFFEKAVLIIALWILGMSSYGQTSKYQMRLAVDILKGKDISNTKEWAVATLEKSIEEDKDAYAMNVLGIAYLHGIGVEADTTKAISYLEAAGGGGYNLAFHNLGMYYKYAADGKQDFTKAYSAFCLGADAGSTACHYNKGFMLYKGLGCGQDYKEAIEEFSKAAEREHPAAMFMLGLCYRNGYGVEADLERASYFLNCAATLGNSDAMEELAKEKPENSLETSRLDKSRSLKTPETMPDIDPYIPNNKKEIGGEYTGYIVTYDWSGQHALSETPVRLDIINPTDSAECIWIVGNDTVTTRAKITRDGELVFGKEQVRRYDRYSASYSAMYRFENAEVCYVDNSITGQLRLFSIDEQEPERPMYVCLKKTGSTQDYSGNINNKIYSYPNPYTDVVTLKFELDADVPSAKICLYSQGGINRQNYDLGALNAGEHSYTIVPDPCETTYVVHVIAGSTVYQTIIIKKQ